ncbi:MAG: HPF/RaiA family ribosome-associated protein, partial [Atribacterota bacterium]|nr:HPF/RaiA family ribosome-associated protein [Atribacterota bacterium]
IFNSIDRVVERLERQIIKYKEKLYSKYGSEYNKEKVADISEREEVGIDIPAEQERKIVRTKRFVIKPMSPEEAGLQMELLGHNFYVFSNEETAQFNVIYKRKDGNFGLIEPEA